jgi:hypothetical protein
MAMQFEKLFNHSKALDNTPTYRNINQPLGESAFDDLLAPGENREEGAAEASKLALRKANQVRMSLVPITAVRPETHHHLAIQRVFQRAASFPTRFSDGSYPVWYGSMESLTTIYETAYHMIREEMNLGDHSRPIGRQRLVYKVACTAILIDLTREKDFFPQLADKCSYAFPQQIGKRIRTEMHPGLLSPSARHREGINLAIFTPRVLSNPEIVENLTYRLDLSSRRLTVRNASNHEIITINGTEFF